MLKEIHRGCYTMAKRYEFNVWAGKQYITRSLRSLVIYYCWHENIKFISSGQRLMLCVSYRQKKLLNQKHKPDHERDIIWTLAARLLVFLNFSGLIYFVRLSKIVFSRLKFTSSCLHFAAPQWSKLCLLQWF